MGEGMIANFVAFGVLALEISGRWLPCCRHEEHAGTFFSSKCPRLRGPFRIGAIVQRKGDFLVRGADLVNV